MSNPGQPQISPQINNSDLNILPGHLVDQALALGAHGAAAISPDQIPIQDSLAALCAELKCDGYGQSMSCPPQVAGPAWLRARLAEASVVLVFKFDVPTDILHSSQRWDLFGLLHETAASLEKTAREAGFEHSFGLAGGSCKNIFCSSHYQCRVLSEGGPCRNPDSARASMSGYGVNVKNLAKVLGWPMESTVSDPTSGQMATALLAGMVVVL
jgi:predicted metal-binding protein